MADEDFILISRADKTVAIEEPETEFITFGMQGPAGVPGAQGPKGDKGDPGMSGVSYEHVQSIAAAYWVIDHGLNRFPSVVTMDSAGDEVEGLVRYESSNQITITFSAPFGGKAYLN